MSKKHSFLPFAIGSMGATLLTLLFAKNSGKDVRKKMQQRKDDGEAATGVLISEVSALKDELLKASKNFWASDNVQDVVSAGKSKLQELFDEAKGKGGEFMEETQKQLLEYSKVAKEKAHELGEEMKRRGGLAMDEFREGFDELREKGTEKITDAKKTAGKKVDEVKERFSKK